MRFRRSISLGKGLRLNISKSGIGVSAGVKGFRIGIGPRGAYTSTSIPGTGLYNINYWGGSPKKGPHCELQVKPNINNPIQETHTRITQEYPSLAEVGFASANTLRYWLAAAASLVFFSSSFGPYLALLLIVLWFRRIRSKPVQLGSKYLKARQYAGFGRYVDAAKLLEEIKAESPSPHVLLALGHTYYYAKENAKAITCYKEYLSQFPDDTGIKLRLATLLAGEKDYAGALSILESLPNSALEDPFVIWLRGGCLVELDKPEAAIEVLKKAPLRKRTPDPVLTAVRYTLGIAYKKAGNKKRALGLFRRVYADDPGFFDIAEQIADLERAGSLEVDTVGQEAD